MTTRKLLFGLATLVASVVGFWLAVVIVDAVVDDDQETVLPETGSAIPVLGPLAASQGTDAPQIDVGALGISVPYATGAEGVPPAREVAKLTDGAGAAALPPLLTTPATDDGLPPSHFIDICAELGPGSAGAEACPDPASPATVTTHEAYTFAQLPELEGSYAAYPPMPDDAGDPPPPAADLTADDTPACASTALGPRDVPIGVVVNVPSRLRVVYRPRLPNAPSITEPHPEITTIDFGSEWRAWFDDADSGWFNWRHCFVLENLEAPSYEMFITATDIFGREEVLEPGGLELYLFDVQDDRTRPPTFNLPYGGSYLYTAPKRTAGQRTLMRVFPEVLPSTPGTPTACETREATGSDDVAGYLRRAEGANLYETPLREQDLGQPDYPWDPSYAIADGWVHRLEEGRRHIACLWWLEGDQVVDRESFWVTPPNRALLKLNLSAGNVASDTAQPVTVALERYQREPSSGWFDVGPPTGDCTAANGHEALPLMLPGPDEPLAVPFDQPLVCDLRELGPLAVSADPMQIVVRQPINREQGAVRADGEIVPVGPWLASVSSPFRPLTRVCDDTCGPYEEDRNYFFPIITRQGRVVGDTTFAGDAVLCLTPGVGAVYAATGGCFATLDTTGAPDRPGLWFTATWEDGPSAGDEFWQVDTPVRWVPGTPE